MSQQTRVVIGEHDWLDPVEMMLRSVAGRLLVGGLAAVSIGAVLVGAPDLSIRTLTLLLGAYLVLSGAALFFFMFRDREDVQRWRSQIGLGLLSFSAGVLLLAWPDVSMGTLAVVVGVVFIGVGAGELITSAMLRSLVPAWRLLGVAGVFSMIAGSIAIVWPDATIRVIAIVLGAQLVLVGLALLEVRRRVVGTLARLAQGRPASAAAATVIDLRDSAAPLRRMTSEWDISWDGSKHSSEQG